MNEISNSTVAQGMDMCERDKLKHIVETLFTTDWMLQHRDNKRYVHTYFNRTATKQNVYHIVRWKAVASSIKMYIMRR